MKTLFVVISKIVSTLGFLFCLMFSFIFMPSVGSFLFAVCAALLFPMQRWQDFIVRKAKLNTAIKIVAVIILFFAGVLTATPEKTEMEMNNTAAVTSNEEIPQSDSSEPEQEVEPEPEKEAESDTEQVQSAEEEIELTDEEFDRVQAVFKEYVGEELEYRPKYCGEWRNGNQFRTENFAYGQYLINMDVDGQVHLVVWVQTKKGEEGRFVIYNRLEDGVAPEIPDDGAIHLIDGYEGEYGETVNGFIHYKVPAGTYTVVNEGERAVVFVVADNDANDERCYLPMTEGESAEITVDEDAHIELSAASMIALIMQEE